MDAKDLNDKLDRLDKMLDKMSKAVEEGNPVLNMPSASGMIADCQTDGIVLLSSLIEACQAKGIPAWIDGRSLLAACRTQNLLPWETELEIGLFDSGWTELNASDILQSIGCSMDGGKIHSATEPEFGRIKPEIVPRVWIVDKATCHLEFGGQTVWTVESCILPLSKATLNGMELPSPCNAWSILEAEFGSGWQKIV